MNPREIEANWSSIHRNQEKFITTGQARAREKGKNTPRRLSNPVQKPNRHAETSPPTNQDSASEKDGQDEHTNPQHTWI
ncbi:MAG: hypothetical protein LKJ05_07080, partial [Bifidobacteriaceae bacterium]|nr:hypothetical protein [Bifidobacteriaceae bacterium]